MKQLFTFLLLCSLTTLTFASEILTGENIEINERSTQNLYLVGGDISVNSPIEGDLLVAGGNVHVQDSLLDDVLMAAGSLSLEAYCADDLRMVAGEVHIAQDILGDLVVTAGEVKVEKNVTIHGSVIALAGEIEIHGTVLGDVRASGGEVEIHGNVQGRLDIRAGEIEIDGSVDGLSTLVGRSIDLGRSASFQNDVAYWSKEEDVDFTDHLANGVKVHFDQDLRSELLDINWEQSMKEGFIYWSGFRVISGLMMTLLIFVFFRNYFSRNAGTTSKGTLGILFTGLAALICLPLISVFAFATIIGIPVGIISSAVLVILLLSSNALASVMGAFEIKHYLNKDWSQGRTLLASMGLFIGLR
ncbi:MAG: polymer-forming cytoskeletal protein, partial [Bacteroidota bacterium]